VREAAIEKYLKQQVKKAGGASYKFTSPGRRGVPDQLALWKSDKNPVTMVDFIELKAKIGKLSPSQKREHARLRDMGIHVFTLDSKFAVDMYILHTAKWL
jgi:hypothetical protein